MVRILGTRIVQDNASFDWLRSGLNWIGLDGAGAWPASEPVEYAESDAGEPDALHNGDTGCVTKLNLESYFCSNIHEKKIKKKTNTKKSKKN